MKKRRIDLTDDEILSICGTTDCNKNRCIIALAGGELVNGDCLGCDPEGIFSDDWLNEEVEIEEGNK